MSITFNCDVTTINYDVLFNLPIFTRFVTLSEDQILVEYKLNPKVSH